MVIDTPSIKSQKKRAMFFSFRKKWVPKNNKGITNQHLASKNLAEIIGFELVIVVISVHINIMTHV